MSKTMLCGLAGAALLVFASSADPVFAIQHGCTNPPDIKSLTLAVDVDGRKSRASGPYCTAIARAVAIIDQSNAQVPQLLSEGTS